MHRRAEAPQLSTVVSGDSVTLNWSRSLNCGADSYTVTAGTIPGGSNAGSFTTEARSRVIAGVPSGTYYVRVAGTNAAGVGAASEEVRIVVQ